MYRCVNAFLTERHVLRVRPHGSECQGFSLWLSHALCVEGPQLFIHQPSRDMSSCGHATGTFVSKFLLVCTSSLSWVCPQQWSVQSRVPVGLHSGAAVQVVFS